MTRFARAKGSKASNEKTPADSTPWEVMKEQLLQSKKENEEIKKREEAEKKRSENYQNFLKEQKVQKRKATWCDFPEADIKQVNNESGKKKKKKELNTTKVIENEFDTSKSDDVSEIKKKKKNKKELTSEKTVEIKTNDTLNSDSVSEIKKKKKKNKNKPKSDSNEDASHSVSDNPADLNMKQKRDKPNKIKEKKVDHESNSEESCHINKPPKNQKKNKKLVNGKPVRRKEIKDNSFQLIINGKEVELVRFDGFPIMKKDAERLQELKNNMIKKGIPKSEVQRTMKLERRRAEKALARLKRDVCYNCRKGGHNLSDCPDLKSRIPGVDAAEGVCFKCGSTEHKQFDCKVQKSTDFKFATCFICKQAGHIARQCPDNPKGLYPNGGGCKLCGDVTHLRKDCPSANTKKEETSIKLQTLDGDNIEDIEQQGAVTTPQEGIKKPKKIKF